jgi:hypothetical protein
MHGLSLQVGGMVLHEGQIAEMSTGEVRHAAQQYSHWMVWFACGCKRCAALGMHDFPVDDEDHLLFSCPATAVIRRECDMRNCIDIVAGFHVLFTGWHYLCTSA